MQVNSVGSGNVPSWQMNVMKWMGLFQHENDGAMPLTNACMGANVESGDFFGPSGFLEFKGPIKKIPRNKEKSRLTQANVDLLWSLSEQAVGTKFEVKK